ncbi:MAG: HPr family phosphocarrier protein [Chloroflexota bacterium]|nr:HPr family phosphocarrier protein [Anaerolineae bacterium]
MQETTVVVHNKVGLHARPAAMFVQLANKFKSDILVAKTGDGDSKEVNAKSILSILTLAVCQGTEVRIRANGEDEEDAVNALCELIETNFGQPNGEA